MARYNLGPCSVCCDALDILCDGVECPSGHVCIGGRCFAVCGASGSRDYELTDCESDADCPEGCACISGVCIDSEGLDGLGSCCEVLAPGADGNDRNCYLRRPYTPGDSKTCIMPESECVDRPDIGVERNWLAINLRSCKQCPATREGACCLPDGTCEVLCETECDSIEGATYKGDLWLDCETPRFPGYSGGACDPEQINCNECCHYYSADFTNPPSCPDGWALLLGDNDNDGVADAPSECMKCEQIEIGADDECAVDEQSAAVQEMVAHINASPNRTQQVDASDVLTSGVTMLQQNNFECADGKCYDGVSAEEDCPENPLP